MHIPNKLHINCDMAESYGHFRIGDDESILPFIDAANIACGFHGGDPLTIIDTVKLAIHLGKSIGAHPSFPDLVGFGRRYMEMSEKELFATIVYQICAVKSIVEIFGGALFHVKPHGALYNASLKDDKIANVIIDALVLVDPNLVLFAPFNSVILKRAQLAGVKVKKEAFADRRYMTDGTLAPRHLSGAVIDSPEEILQQCKNILSGKAETWDKNYIDIESDTICLHGDHPCILQNLSILRSNFT